MKTYLARMPNHDKDMTIFLFDSIVRPEYAVGPAGIAIDVIFWWDEN